MKPRTSGEYLDEACRLSRQALELDGSNVLASSTLGQACVKTGKHGESIALLEAALKNPAAAGVEAEELNLCLGQAYCHVKQTERAQACFKKAARMPGSSPLPYLLMASCALTLGDDEAAAGALLRAADMDPSFANSYSVLGGVYFFLGRYESAAEALRKNVAVNGPNIVDDCGAAACLLETDSAEKALTALEALAAAAPPPASAPPAHDGRAFDQRVWDSYVALARQASPAGARENRTAADIVILEACARLISQKTGGAARLSQPRLLPRYLLCAAYSGLGMQDRLIEACQTILEFDAADPLAARLLSGANAPPGAPQKVIELYKRVFARNGRDIEAALKIVDLYLETGDLDLALVYCRKALDIDAEHPQANYKAGLIQLRKVRPFAALPHLLKAAERDDADAAAFLALGEAHAQARDEAAARHAWERAAAADKLGECGRQARSKLAALAPSAEPDAPAGPEQGGSDDGV